MKKLRVALVAFRGAGDGMFEKGRARLSQLIAPEQVEFVEQQPDVIYFLSGGSERAVTTHFETGVGTAIQGDFAADDVTIFRLDSSLRRAFLTCAPVLARPRYAHACRTQIEVALPPQAVRLLRDSPLGNHHLILPGNHADRLRLACLRFGLEAQK